MRFTAHCRLLLLALLLLAGGHAGLCYAPRTTLSPDEVIKKAVAHAQSAKVERGRADYAYTKQVVVQDFDKEGRITETKEKLFHFRSGFGSLEQVKINGRVACGAELKKEEERVARQLVDPKSTKRDDHWEKYLTPELISKYEFKLRERTLLNGRPTYVIAFQPLNGNLPIRQMADHLLNQLAGTVWIDEQDSEIARAEISAQSKITLGGMLEILGSLKRFKFALERVRMEDGIWFNRVARGEFEGRKLLDNTHVKTRSETSDFRKVTPQ